MGDRVDLRTPWNNVINGIAGTAGQNLLTLLAAVGVLILVFALLSFFWQRRKGGGMSGMGSLTMPIIIGGILAAPRVVIPILLWLIEVAVNFILGIVNSFQ